VRQLPSRSNRSSSSSSTALKTMRMGFGNSRSVGCFRLRFVRRLKGTTAPVVLLQYPVPRLPLILISRMVCLVASSVTMLTSRNSSREASSGLSPVFAMKST
jgi:hypothetical protein